MFKDGEYVCAISSKRLCNSEEEAREKDKELLARLYKLQDAEITWYTEVAESAFNPGEVCAKVHK